MIDMVYANIEELPVNVKNSFRPADRKAWMESYNSHLTDITDKKEEKIPGMDEFMSASVMAWKDSMTLPSSRSFVAQITAQIVDLQGEVVPVSELIKLSKQFILNGGSGHSNHTSQPPSTYWFMEEGKDKETGKPSVIAYGNYFRDELLYDKDWASFVDGDEDEFSIGASVQRRYECDADECHTVAHPKQLFEVSTTPKGANPRTGIMWINIPNGEGDKDSVKTIKSDFVLKSCNNAECPVRTLYLDFKAEMGKMGVSTNWIAPVIVLEGEKLGSDDITKVIRDFYANAYISTVMPHDDGTLTQIIVPKSKIESASKQDIVFLIIDELEAIDGYRAVITAVENSELDDESKKYIIEKFNEIINDEVDHARIDYNLMVRAFLPAESEDGNPETESAEEIATKGCPMGQHEHPGVIGCHDINQVHDEPKHLAAPGKIDLTNEQVDVNAILKLDTPRLQSIVTKIASALQGRGDDEISEFMRSPMGKELVLMILELRKRKLQSEGGSNMIDETKKSKEKAEVKTASATDSSTVISAAESSTVTTTAPAADAVAESTKSADMGQESEAKKSDVDALGDMANTEAIMAYLKAGMDNALGILKAIEAKIAVNNGQSSSIASAVGQAVNGLTGGNETEGGEPDGDEGTEGAKEPDGDEGEHKEPDGDEGQHAEPDGDEAVPPKAESSENDEEKKPVPKKGEVEKSDAEPVPTATEAPETASVDDKCHGRQAEAIHAQEDAENKSTEVSSPAVGAETKVTPEGGKTVEEDKCHSKAQAAAIHAAEEDEANKSAVDEFAKKNAELMNGIMSKEGLTPEAVSVQSVTAGGSAETAGVAVKSATPVSATAPNSLMTSARDATNLATYLTAIGLDGKVTATITGTPGSLNYGVTYKASNGSDIVVAEPKGDVKLATADILGFQAGTADVKSMYRKMINGDLSDFNQMRGN